MSLAHVLHVPRCVALVEPAHVLHVVERPTWRHVSLAHVLHVPRSVALVEPAHVLHVVEWPTWRSRESTRARLPSLARMPTTHHPAPDT